VAGTGVITPKVGMRCLYHPHPGDKLLGNDGIQPLAATIAYVHNPRKVNLGVLDSDGNAHTACKVQLLQGDDKPTGSTWAFWPTCGKCGSLPQEDPF